MNILILSGDNDLQNAGDNAMLIVTAGRLQGMRPAARLRVVTRRPDRLRRLIPFAEPVVIDSGAARALRPLRALAGPLVHAARGWRNARRTGQMRAIIEAADAVVLAGQGVMTDAFAAGAAWRLAVLEAASQRGIPAALFSQGIGPISQPELRAAMQRALPQVGLIAVREDLYARQALLDSGCRAEQIVMTGDDAYALACRVRARQPASVGVNIRAAAYAGVTGPDEERLHTLRRALASVEAPLRVIPIAAADAAATRSFLKQVPPPRSEPDIQQVLAAIARCRVVVAGSYHAAALSLAHGVPAICLIFSDYYAIKFRGLAAQFPEGCFLLDWRGTQPGVEEVRDAIADAWNASPALSGGLRASAGRYIERSYAAYREFNASL